VACGALTAGTDSDCVQKDEELLCEYLHLLPPYLFIYIYIISQKDEALLCEYLHLPPSVWRSSVPAPSGGGGGGCGPPALRAAVGRLRSIAREATPEGKARVLVQTRRLAVEAILAAERRARRAQGDATPAGKGVCWGVVGCRPRAHTHTNTRNYTRTYSPRPVRGRHRPGHHLHDAAGCF
jgi:hypothetical protein